MNSLNKFALEKLIIRFISSKEDKNMWYHAQKNVVTVMSYCQLDVL